MPTDGNYYDQEQKSHRGRRKQEREEGNLSGLFASHSGSPDTLIELMWPERFPAAADSGDLGNSYISGMAALQQVFNPAGVGPFVRPRENTFIRHELAVIGGRLDFNPKKYEFDNIVAHFAELPQVFDKKNRHYEKYADLRLNLAVMRNYLLNHFFPDGDVENDKEDRRAAHSLNQIAMYVGDMLHRGNRWLPSLGPSVTLSRASEKGTGAAEIYQKLRTGEKQRLLLSPVLVPVNLIRNRSNMIWRLPPLPETPFDPRNLAAPLDTYMPDEDIGTYGGGTGGEQAPLPDRERWNVISHSFADLGAGLAGATVPLATVDDLSQPVKTRAIELAREILEKLKLKFSDTPVEALLDRVDTAEVYQLLRETQRLSDLFYMQAGRAALTHPDFFEDRDIVVAFDALGKLSCQAKLQALKYAEESGSDESALRIAREIEAMPASWRDPGTFTVGHLLGSVQIGLEKIFRQLQAQTQTNDDARHVGYTDPSLLPPGTIGQGNGLASQNSPAAVPSISPLQQRMQQVMAANDMVNMAAERRTQQSSVYQAASSGQSVPSAAAIAAAEPPPRPSGRRSRQNTGVVQARQSRQQQAVMQAAQAPTVPAAGFGSMLKPEDLASLRGSVNTAGMNGPVIGPRRAKDTIRDIANASRDPLASQQPDTAPGGSNRPGGGSFNGR